jgi:hypothetical protein
MYTTRSWIHASAGVDGFASRRNPIYHSPRLERLGTEGVLQTEACQDASQFEYFNSLSSPYTASNNSKRTQPARARARVAVTGTMKYAQ